MQRPLTHHILRGRAPFDIHEYTRAGGYQAGGAGFWARWMRGRRFFHWAEMAGHAGCCGSSGAAIFRRQCG